MQDSRECKLCQTALVETMKTDRIDWKYWNSMWGWSPLQKTVGWAERHKSDVVCVPWSFHRLMIVSMADATVCYLLILDQAPGRGSPLMFVLVPGNECCASEEPILHDHLKIP